MEANKSILKFYEEFKRVALSFQLITNPLQPTKQGYTCRLFNKRHQTVLIHIQETDQQLTAVVIEHDNTSLKHFVTQLLEKLLHPVIQLNDVPQLLKKRKLTFDTISQDHVNAMYISTHGEDCYFGPQVISACHLNQNAYHAFLKQGFSNWTYLSTPELDSVTQQIKERTLFSTIRLGNESYNAVYDKMGNHYHILAWSFAKIIETMKRQRQIDVVIIPPFNGSLLIQDMLISKGLDVTIYHATPPEHLLGYHLAKCLAVTAFKEELTRLESILKLSLPLQPEYNVLATALEYATEHGLKGLKKITKYHYPMTDKVNQALLDS